MKSEVIKDESEIAKVAMYFLENNGWDVYPEVVIDVFGGRPDYVCVKNSLCQVVECKKTLSYPVIEQLARWQIDAEKRKEWGGSVAIPHLLTAFVARTSQQKGGISDLKRIFLEKYRIGVFSVSKRMNLRTLNKSGEPYLSCCMDDYWHIVWGDYEYQIRQEVMPKIQVGSRRTAQLIIESLDDDMKIATSGVKGGETDYMTPFKRTMNRVKKVLSDGKERHIQDIIDEIRPLGGHHYCSDKVASSSISKFIDKFGIAQRSREWGAWFIVESKKGQ